MWKLLFYLLTISTIIDIGNNQVLAKVSVIKNTDCNVAFLKSVFMYFEDMHILIFLDFTSENILDSLICTNGNNFRPLMSRRDPRTPALLNITKSSINPHPTHYGTALKGNSQLMIESHFPRLYNFNPRTKIICLLDETDDETIRKTLKTGFDRFNFVTIAALVKEPFFNVTSGNNGTISKFCVYHPYDGPGRLNCKRFVESNVEQVMTEMMNYFRSRFVNMKGYRIKVHIFEYDMLSKPVYDKNGIISRFEYVDGEIVEIMAKYLNFTPVYLDADKIHKHGIQLPNGIFTGSLAAAEYGFADLIANHRVKMDYNTSTALFLDQILLGRFYFLIPAPVTTKEILISMIMSVDFTTRVLFLACLMSFSPLLYLIAKIEAHFYDYHGRISFQEATMAIVGITSNLSVKPPIFRSSRLLFASVLFYTIIFTSLIHSLITQNLNTKIESRDVKTLDEILDHGYDLNISPELKIMFKNLDGSRMARKLREIANDELNSQSSKLSDISTAAILLPEMQIETYLNKFYDKTTKVGIYKRVPEIAFQSYESMMVPKRSPFQASFNKIIRLLAQTGIAQYQLHLAQFENKKIMIKRVKDGDVPAGDDIVIRLEDLDTIFYSYLVANGISLLVFAFEICFRRICGIMQ